LKITPLCLLSLSCTLLVAQLHNGPTSTVPKLSISKRTEQTISKIIGDTLVDGQAYEYDRQIADEIGPRLTGSANYLRAVEWSIAKFNQFGLTNVHTEKFRMDTWEPDGPASGRITSPVEHTLHVYSYGWSPSTPGDWVRAKVIFPRGLTEQGLNAQRNEIRGSLIVLDRRAFPGQFSPSKAAAIFNTLDAIAPAGLLIVGGSNGTEDMSASTLDGKLATYPVAEIGVEDGSLLRRLTDRGPVTVEMAFKTRTRRNVEVPQVVAEIRGSESPDEVVIVSAHLDSWQPGTGAQDNGTGVSTVLDAAREIQSLGRAPKRTIRFILFGGEEQYLVGSRAYVRQHAAEMNKITALINTDTGSETPHGWILLGRDDEDAALSPLNRYSGPGNSDQAIS
jgi:carboxypeptidase Q